jgi:hypothetical protein
MLPWACKAPEAKGTHERVAVGNRLTVDGSLGVTGTVHPSCIGSRSDRGNGGEPRERRARVALTPLPYGAVHLRVGGNVLVSHAASWSGRDVVGSKARASESRPASAAAQAPCFSWRYMTDH